MSMTEREFLTASYIAKTVSSRDILDDMQRMSRVCAIISKDDLGDEGRLLLNQLITLCNVFYVGNMLVLLEERLEPQYHNKLYSIGVSLGFLKEEHYPIDLDYANVINDILNEEERYGEIFESFCRRRSWG